MADADIDFVFSVPGAVGAEGALILQEAAKNAGFKSNIGRGNHKVCKIMVNEAEAAAISVLRDMSANFQARERIMVIDVGGGTSDVTMVIATSEGKFQHDDVVMIPSTSEKLGGAYVDRDLRDCILNLMMEAGVSRDNAMSKVKEIFKDQQLMNARNKGKDLKVDISVARPTKGVTTRDMRIEGSELVVHSTAFDSFLVKQLFGPGGENNRAKGIIEQVVTMRDDLHQRVPSYSADFQKKFENEVDVSQSIDVVVFSGGVCKSEHLQSVIKAYMKMVPEELRGTNLAKVVANTRFLVSADPHMCVAKGLVYARLQQLEDDSKAVWNAMLSRMRG